MTQVTKTFVGTDGVNITANDPTLSYPSGAANAPALVINANKAVAGNDNGGDQFVYINNQTFAQRQKVSVTYANGPGTTDVGGIELVLRADGTASNYLIWYVSNGFQGLYSTIGGVTTDLARDTFLAAAPGDVFSMEIDAASTTIQFTKNGVAGANKTVTSTQVPSGSRIGAGIGGAQTTRMPAFSAFTADDFAVTVAPVISSPQAISPTANGVTARVTSDTAGGTVYAVATSTNVAPSAAQIKAGSGATIVGAGNTSGVAGVNNITVTGLTDATTYYLWFLHSNGLDSNIPGSVSFTTATITPTVVSASSTTPRNGESVTLTTLGMKSTQGTVTLGGVAQTVTAWTPTSITFTVNRGDNKYGTALALVATTFDAIAANYNGITGLSPQTGWSYTNVATPNAVASKRLTGDIDIVNGDQIAYSSPSGNIVVNGDGTFAAANGVTSFTYEIWTAVYGWGASAAQTV